jgi:hypothetical protein
MALDLKSFYVKNLTKRPITLGDLVNVLVPPGETIDLLKQPLVTKEKINKSVHLRFAVRSGWIEILSSTALTLVDEALGPVSGSGATVLDDLTDVDISGTPTNYTTIIYDPISGLWKNKIPQGGTINRTGDLISSVDLDSGETWTFTRDIDGKISSIDNGQTTWTFARDVNGNITSWSIA